jgi:hypothetical protein
MRGLYRALRWTPATRPRAWRSTQTLAPKTELGGWKLSALRETLSSLPPFGADHLAELGAEQLAVEVTETVGWVSFSGGSGGLPRPGLAAPDNDTR